jgi:hypothetical protein
VQYTFGSSGSSGQKSAAAQNAEAAAIAPAPAAAPDYTASALNYVNMLA